MLSFPNKHTDHGFDLNRAIDRAARLEPVLHSTVRARISERLAAGPLREVFTAASCGALMYKFNIEYGACPYIVPVSSLRNPSLADESVYCTELQKSFEEHNLCRKENAVEISTYLETFPNEIQDNLNMMDAGNLDKALNNLL